MGKNKYRVVWACGLLGTPQGVSWVRALHELVVGQKARLRGVVNNRG
jgi:hypothetical protein